MSHRLTLGLPNMHQEAGERRAFLPDFVRKAAKSAATASCWSTVTGPGWA